MDIHDVGDTIGSALLYTTLFVLLLGILAGVAAALWDAVRSLIWEHNPVLLLWMVWIGGAIVIMGWHSRTPLAPTWVMLLGTLAWLLSVFGMTALSFRWQERCLPRR
jgi:hypothetical protein